MPYQNLDSEMMFAVSIWLLAIIVFIVMSLAVCAKLLSEKRTKGEHRSTDQFQTGETSSSPNKELEAAKEAEFQNPI